MERTSERVQPYLAPLFGILVLAGCLLAHPHRIFVIIPVAGLIVSVLAAVTNAEVIAHRVGEPLGAIILALCVTVIEASLPGLHAWVDERLVAGGSVTTESDT